MGARELETAQSQATHSVSLDKREERVATLQKPITSRQLILQLQRYYGNRYVQRMVDLARKGDEDTEVAPDVEDAIQRARGGGQALDTSVQEQMELAFGTDFSGVRVHTGAEADALNRAVRARAFTTGQDIFFRNGEYVPSNSDGLALLVHELTHVIQQSKAMQHKINIGRLDDEQEYEAESTSKDFIQQLRSSSPRKLNISQQNESHQKSSLQYQGGGKIFRYPKKSEMVIRTSQEEINRRLDLSASKINDQIQTWTELGVGDFRDGIQDAVLSFENWYSDRPKKINTPAFLMTIVHNVIGIIGPLAVIGGIASGPAAGLAVAVLTAITRQARFHLTQQYDPNGDTKKEIKKLKQNAINFGNWLDKYYDNWGKKLKKEARPVWNSIGLTILDGFQLDRAKEILNNEGCVPRINVPYAKTILQKLISDYLEWELKQKINWDRWVGPNIPLSTATREELEEKAEIETEKQMPTSNE